jgi:hypothetical protein
MSHLGKGIWGAGATVRWGLMIAPLRSRSRGGCMSGLRMLLAGLMLSVLAVAGLADPAAIGGSPWLVVNSGSCL